MENLDTPSLKVALQGLTVIDSYCLGIKPNMPGRICQELSLILGFKLNAEQHLGISLIA
jgi:hypothetical protein